MPSGSEYGRGGTLTRAHLWWLYLLATILGIGASFIVAGTWLGPSSPGADGFAYDALDTSAVVAVLVGLAIRLFSGQPTPVNTRRCRAAPRRAHGPLTIRDAA